MEQIRQLILEQIEQIVTVSARFGLQSISFLVQTYVYIGIVDFERWISVHSLGSLELWLSSFKISAQVNYVN